MSSLSSVYIKKETLKTLLDTVSQKGEKGIELTVSINEEVNQWGQNLSAYVSQTEEERKAKKNRYYVGNGKVFWTDGVIAKADRPQPEDYKPANNTPQEEEDDLPF